MPDPFVLCVIGLILSTLGSSAVAFRAQRTTRELHLALQQANQTIVRWHERTLEGPARRPLPSDAPTQLLPVPRSPAPATIGARHQQQRPGGRR